MMLTGCLHHYRVLPKQHGLLQTKGNTGPAALDRMHSIHTHLVVGTAADNNMRMGHGLPCLVTIKSVHDTQHGQDPHWRHGNTTCRAGGWRES